MDNKLKVLHIASFNGNIGDNANHNGFYYLFKKNITDNVEFDQLEMRRFYFSWNDKKFDESFAKKANRYDLVVFGGGNFFDITWPDSATGTTIDIQKLILEKIDTPIFFNALGLGYGIDKNFNEKAVDKFKAFLDYITNNDQFFVTLRNDGSYENLEKLYGAQYLDRIYEIPDNGFFIQTGDYDHSLFTNGYKSIGINLVYDGKENRFPNDITYKEFVNKFALIVEDFLKEHKDYQVIFFPHIYNDIFTINNAIENIDDKIRRYRIKIAPYLSGQGVEKYIFSLYEECDLIMGMRFHSNVVAIGRNIPSIGLATNHYRVPSLYSKLGIEDRFVRVNMKKYNKKLKRLFINEFRSNYDNLKLTSTLSKKSNQQYKKIKRWLEINRVLNV
jgi:polysaccharide pyruvyl transferase WcaK-like protein